MPTTSGNFPFEEEDVNKYLKKIKRQNAEIVFFGSDPWSIHVLKALEETFDVKAVITAPESAVANYFKGLVLIPEKLNDELLNSHFSFLTSDLFVVASYGKIIPKSILDIPKYGALNIHPSLLPKYRGSSPVPSTILNGDKETGVTIMKMDGKMDHGPLIITKQISLSGKENFQELINKLFQLGAELLVGIIPDFIAGKVVLKEQDHSKATFTKLIKKEDGYFEINNPPSPDQLDRMIRAYYPWPGVWTKWRIKNLESRIKERIVKFLPNGMIQIEGKKPVDLKTFLNGYPDFPIKQLA